jgi:hypothetical protein
LNGVIEGIIREGLFEFCCVLEEPFSNAGLVREVGSERVIGEEIEEGFGFSSKSFAAERKGGFEKVGIVS